MSHVCSPCLLLSLSLLFSVTLGSPRTAFRPQDGYAQGEQTIVSFEGKVQVETLGAGSDNIEDISTSIGAGSTGGLYDRTIVLNIASKISTFAASIEGMSPASSTTNRSGTGTRTGLGPYPDIKKKRKKPRKSAAGTTQKFLPHRSVDDDDGTDAVVAFADYRGPQHHPSKNN